MVSNILADLMDVLTVTTLFELSRERCIALLPGSVAATVNVKVDRRLNNCIAIAITIVIVANILNGVFTGTLYGVFRVARPVTGKVTVNASSRTINATGTVRVNRTRNTVDDLSVTISKVLAIYNTVVFSGVV